MRAALAIVLVACSSKSAPSPSTTSSSSSEPTTSASVATSPTLESPLMGYEALRRAACERDVDGFFARIDREGIRASLIDHMRNKMPEQMKDDELATHVNKAFEETLDGWTKDVQQGRESSFCKWSLVSENADGTLRIKRPSGRTSTLRFERIDGTMRLVKMTADDS